MENWNRELTPSQPARELLVPKALDELQYSLDELEKQVESITVRLSKILTPDTRVENSKTPPINSGCEYVDVILEKSRLVRRIGEKLHGLEVRLEV